MMPSTADPGLIPLKENREYFVDDPRVVVSSSGEPAFVGPDALVTYLSNSDPSGYASKGRCPR
jgi:hypothetical protein